jgi:elongation factor P--(R)-beta-lysine ligase
LIPEQENTSLESKQSCTQQRLAILRDRSEMLHRARAFFRERSILEVDCPALHPTASIDAHIDVMKVPLFGTQIGYLHSSPEYGMKRLVAAGLGDIYQMSHVFRDHEIGPYHNPEFTMVEWYRCHFSFEQMIQETCAFIQLFLQDMPVQTHTYQKAFYESVGIDPFRATIEELVALLRTQNVMHSQLGADWDRDMLLHLCMSFFVEPQLNKNALTVITYFPSTQAALANTIETEEGLVAHRFEVFCGHVELANGYHELADSKEIQLRFEEANFQRLKNGKDALPIDYSFLSALQEGFPDCCGVAVGFDRLMMLRHSCSSLHEVLPFSWKES